ncbi:NACHT domain-containing protein [Streptomyces sp. NPDC002853]
MADDGVGESGGPLPDLGARLRVLRLQRGLTMGGLQRLTGLGRTTLSQALGGKRLPSEATVVALAGALKADASPLLALHRQAALSHSPTSRVGRGASRPVQDFAQRYLAYVSRRHADLTVVGLDLARPDRACWPLDAAYLSLELAEQRENWDRGSEGPLETSVVCRAEQALAGRQRILLKGLAGSGKTTLLQWLAVSAARAELPEELTALRERVPFVLPLRTLARRGPLPQPQDFLAAVGAPLADAQPPGWADAVLQAGSALVLVDGVDEVPQEHRAATRQWLSDLLATYKDAAFVVTTRPSAVPDGWLAPLGFSELSVRPMSAADTGLFIGRWHAAAQHSVQDEAEHAHLEQLEALLQVTVRAERDVAQLSTTPLMCALICALHRERRGHLPHSRMELYEAALSMLLARRDRERSIAVAEGIELTEHQSMQLLQRLAYWLIRNQQTEMDYTTALHLVGTALPAMSAVASQGGPAEVLAHLVGRSGLLRLPTADTVDFVHRTFQDYLGAKAAVENVDFPLLVNNAHDDQWEDVVRMAVAHARPQEADMLLMLLVDRGDREEECRSRLHLLAAASMPYATETAPHVRAEVERRTSTLLPPRSPEEAESLAALGPGILDLLPQRADHLKTDEIAAVLRTATAIGGDPGLAFLQRLAPTLAPSVSGYELIRGWTNFEAEGYARDILVPFPGNLLPEVRTLEQQQALRLLTPIPRASFDGSFSAKEILRHLSPDVTRMLNIYRNDVIEDLGFLRDLPALRDLSVSGGGQLRTLDGLAGLDLTALRLLELVHEVPFDVLASLPHLTELSLYTLLPWRNLSRLPAPKGLTSLWMGRQIAASATGISQWQGLEEVALNHIPDSVEWQEIASLPQLRRLFLRDCDFTQVPCMPEIHHLALVPERSDTRLDLIPSCFPDLKSMSLGCRNSAPDVTPLQEIAGLQLSLNFPSHVTGLQGFPPDSLTLYPRPRHTGERLS